MTNPLARFLVPAAVGALASAGAIVGTLLVRERREQRSLSAPTAPLAFDGWWNSDASSPLAYAHPAVLFVDTTDGRILDSWDRRTRSRIERPRRHWSEEYPRDRVIVIDAETGDLLGSLAVDAGMARS